MQNSFQSIRPKFISGLTTFFYPAKFARAPNTVGIRPMSAQTVVGKGEKSPAIDCNAEDVIIHKIDTKRVITLNRPKSLNALTLPMIRKIVPNMLKYNNSPDVNLIIVKGEGGKAFCAGGDVKAICESRETNPKYGLDYFREEYQMNFLIGSLKVPYVAIIDGITMGGGVGLSVHGAFRVATERTLLAMPECQIGLFPDVGGTYFLPRIPGRLGTYLALTGHRLKGREVFDAGIATHYISSEFLKDLEKQLLILKAETVSKGSVASILAEYSLKSNMGHPAASTLKSLAEKIDVLFNSNEIDEIIENLKCDRSDWANSVLDTLSKMSPTSLKITMRALHLGAKMNLQECLKMEYRLACRCCENVDFSAGVRAALIEKTNKPVWNPSSLKEVTPELVDHYFSNLPEDQELKFLVL